MSPVVSYGFIIFIVILPLFAFLNKNNSVDLYKLRVYWINALNAYWLWQQYEDVINCVLFFNGNIWIPSLLPELRYASKDSISQNPDVDAILVFITCLLQTSCWFLSVQSSMFSVHFLYLVQVSPYKWVTESRMVKNNEETNVRLLPCVHIGVALIAIVVLCLDMSNKKK